MLIDFGALRQQEYNQNQQVACKRNQPMSVNINQFAWDLFKQIEIKNQKKNVIINPMTVQYVLSLLNLASADSTKIELCKVSLVDDPQDFNDIISKTKDASTGRNEYAAASGVFVDQKIDVVPNFLGRIRNTPGLTLRKIDFSGPSKHQSIADINAWASENTRNTINEILNPANDYSSTKMLITNAAFFKGTWRTAFRPSFYEDGFKINNNQRIHVPFMYQQKHFNFGPINDPQTNNKLGHFLEIPYESNIFSMLLLVPMENQPLQKLIEKLQLQTVLNQVERGQPHDVNVTIPKFELKSSESLVEPLTAMGLTDTFSSQASFPYMLQRENAAISLDMVQDAYINVDEKGTRAGKHLVNREN